MSLKLNENNLNEFGRYDELKRTVDKTKAKDYFEKMEGIKIIPPKIMMKADILLRDFILSGGFDIGAPAEEGSFGTWNVLPQFCRIFSRAFLGFQGDFSELRAL